MQSQYERRLHGVRFVAGYILLALLLDLISQRFPQYSPNGFFTSVWRIVYGTQAGGSSHMKYRNATTILPDALVKELQKYVQAEYLYIPAKNEQHKAWGELSGYRKELKMRNAAIIAEYRQGTSIETLADRYCLSIYTVRKIIYQK